MSEIYRKTGLDKISGVEQLNKAIVIVSPSFWLVMLGAAGIIAAATLWAFLGRLEENVSATGIYMNRGGIHSLYSDTDGVVESIQAHTGDHVIKGDVIATFSSGKNISSMIEGTLTELAIVEGEVITTGQYVAKVALGDPEDNVVVCYVPVEEGRKIQVGMDASIYPSTVNRQEYGHMKGKVAYVDEYVTSREVIENQVGVITLVDSFLENGPVIEVRLELQKDDSTKSGYWWSSSRGAQLKLLKGTMILTDIAVAEIRPVSLILPDVFAAF